MILVMILLIHCYVIASSALAICLEGRRLERKSCSSNSSDPSCSLCSEAQSVSERIIGGNSEQKGRKERKKRKKAKEKKVRKPHKRVKRAKQDRGKGEVIRKQQLKNEPIKNEPLQNEPLKFEDDDDSSSPIDDFADDTINECKSEWGKEMPYIKGKGKPLSLKQRTKPKGLLPLAPQDVSPPSIDMDPAREQKTQDFLFSKDGKELNKVAMPIQNEIRKGKFISESAEKLQPEPYEEQETQKHSDQKFRNFLHLQKIPYKYSRPLFGRKARSAECSQEIASFRKQLLARKPFQTSLREWKIVGIHEQPEQRYSIENFQQSKEKFTYSYEGMQQEGLFSNEATQESLEEADVGVEFKGKKMLPLGEKTSSIEEKHNLPKPSRRKKKVSSEDHSLDKTESYSEEHCNKVKRTDQLNFHKPVSLKHHVARHHDGHDLLRGTKKKASPGLKKTSSPHRLAVQKAMIRNRDLVYKQKGDAQKGSKEQLSKENISAQKIARRENRPSKVLIGNAKHDFRQSAHSPKKVKQTARQSKQSQSKLKDLHRQSQDTPKYKIHSRQKGVRRVDGRMAEK